MKKVKTEAKSSFIKTPVNIKKTIKKFIVRPAAFIALFIFASYGVRHALETLQDPMQIGLTIFTVFAIGYILVDTND